MTSLSLVEQDQIAFHKKHGCGTTTNIGEQLSFGYGDLDMNGFWSEPCIYVTTLRPRNDYPQAWHVVDRISGDLIITRCNWGMGKQYAEPIKRYKKEDFGTPPNGWPKAGGKSWICLDCRRGMPI